MIQNPVVSRGGAELVNVSVLNRANGPLEFCLYYGATDGQVKGEYIVWNDGRDIKIPKGSMIALDLTSASFDPQVDSGTADIMWNNPISKTWAMIAVYSDATISVRQ